MFLSKKERAELALKKRQEEVDAKKKKLTDEKESRTKYLREGGHRQITVHSTVFVSYMYPFDWLMLQGREERLKMKEVSYCHSENISFYLACSFCTPTYALFVCGQEVQNQREKNKEVEAIRVSVSLHSMLTEVIIIS